MTPYNFFHDILDDYQNDRYCDLEICGLLSHSEVSAYGSNSFMSNLNLSHHQISFFYVDETDLLPQTRDLLRDPKLA